MTTPTLAIDVSNYSGAISPQQAHDLYAAGIRRAIVQAVNPQTLTHKAQIPNLLAAGIEVQGYVYIWFSEGIPFVTQRVTWACQQFAEYDGNPLMRKDLWLDCEQSNNDKPSFDYIHAATSPTIRAAIKATTDAGRTPGIYTAAWWWIPGVSNSPEFAYLPLWVATYDLSPDLDPVNFGGWTVPRMEQYHGDTTLAGVPMVDLDSYIAQTTPPPLKGGASVFTTTMATAAWMKAWSIEHNNAQVTYPSGIKKVDITDKGGDTFELAFTL